MRTLLITTKEGEEFQVDVPDEWKVTYGPAVVGMASSERSGKMIPMALRLYEGENQRAIFTDVTSFRDMSIPIRVKKVNTQEKDGYMECEGVRKRTTFQARNVSWVNPDEEVPAENLPKLGMPSDTEVFGEAKNMVVEEEV